MLDAIISIERKSYRLIGRLSTFAIEINGRQVARMAIGDKVEIPVKSGSNYVKVKGTKADIEVNLQSGERVRLLVDLGTRDSITIID
ncbi:hypothetical protein LO762_24965 [Actinocorallia sp. API 0066]|uniref:hypothetical protein n=1 Tax=Actinocorallia sp. API 0066 TaxID=2896846 RepID=UPI001E3DBABF|nr:hypothetical protein [Actinocorallia sp. API 0066]MCD0452414.1 hypothetical protein [Actinocorallia sp. API 0066]